MKSVTWTDPQTSLIWQAEQNPVRMTWDEAMAYAKKCRTGGHTDWRLPTIKELLGVINYDKHTPATGLPDARSCYWSSSSYAGGTAGAWSVNFNSGSVDGLDKTAPYYVRCVRVP